MKKIALITLVLILVLAFTGCGGNVVTNGIATPEQVDSVKGQMQEDLLAGEFAINGQIYQFPVNAKSLFDAGWYVDKTISDELAVIPANTRTTPIKLLMNGANGYGKATMVVVFSNEIAMDRPIEETDILSITFEKSTGATLVLPKGITWENTFDEIIEVYELEESEYVEEENFLTIICVTDNSDYVQMFFDYESRTLESVSFH